DDIYLISDNTDEQQNRFLEALAAQYIPEVTVSSTSCGYACSDHVSWSERGYPASFPFESAFGEEDPYIHTAEDTYSNAGGQSLHALKFARLALAFAVEIGDVARDPSSTGDNGNPGDGNNNDGASEPDPATSFGDGGSGGVGGLALLMLGLVALTRRLCLRTVSDYR
ncbi:MAG TPA: M28 family peptidase, partial [Gammaproteobacteria bacterium]|nr:M28 family peptidase [Gammaproteobacteria bacterium]